MTDTTEVEKWIILHGELVREHDGPLVRATLAELKGQGDE